MRYSPLLFLVIAANCLAIELKDVNCSTSSPDKGYRIRVRNEEGRPLIWLNAFEKKKEDKVLEKQTAFYHEDPNNCEIFVVSSNPSEVLFELKLRFSDFEKKEIHNNVKLRGNWNFLYGDKYVNNHFYRLAECTLSGLKVSSNYQRACSAEPAKKIEYKEIKKETWRPDRSGNRRGGGIQAQ